MYNKCNLLKEILILNTRLQNSREDKLIINKKLVNF